MTLAAYMDEQRGRMTELAKALGIYPSLVSMWVSGERKVAPEWCLAIERFTGGVVTVEELRPDINWKRAKKGRSA